MSRAFAKSDRIGQVTRLLLASRIPLSQAEIARRCEVHRATIGRLIQGMIDNGIPVRTTEAGLLYIERTAYISQVHLRLHEALAVFLAGRLLARHSDKPNAHTVEALDKLGASLQAVMPALGQHISTTSAALRTRLPKAPSDHQRVLERLTEAWATGVKVRIWYRPLRARTSFEHLFAPYFLEPSALGYSTYAVGLAEPPGALHIRKLERVARVELTDEPFAVPSDFDPNALLAGAWGIWFDVNDRPTSVTLRFDGSHAIQRMRETVWHPSQRVESDSEGRLRWMAEIDEPQEMLPWIRGWGGDCEVLAPPELRTRVRDDVRRQARLYAIAETGRLADTLVAHTPPPGTDNWHLLIDHLIGVAELARGFAEPFGAGALAYQLGLWHDVGKSNPDFQAYLRRCHRDPNYKGHGPDHKAAGSALAVQHLPLLAMLVQGHHGGLRTKNECDVWLNKRRAEDVEIGGRTPAVEAAVERMRALLPALDPSARLPVPAFVKGARTTEFFLRMLFSALVDADFIDTERHFNAGKAALRAPTVGIPELLERFAVSQSQLTGQGDNLVSQARDAMYQDCVRAADEPPGLFRLAIPTGGGKTRSAMAFALRHALRHGLQRIIVAVPFISITEQTADVYRSIFQADDDRVVLEHHSGGGQRDEADDYSPQERWRRMAAENWDAPVIVTTTVQLFESMFGNRTTVCRKLHRLAGSVIILDEVQALPPHLLAPILDGVQQLCAHYGTTVVLSTATQPAFESVKPFAELQAREIVPDAARWFTALKRVSYDWQLDRPLGWAEVAAQLRAAPQALAVVNTKKDALALLDALGDAETLHLSTLLCGAHRRAVIAEVKQRLKAGQPCRLVSTQVIEAGVDLDFPLVLRALGPLDRIIQAAGRCNREGRLERGRVIVFEPAEGGLPQGAYRTATNLTRVELGRGDLDPDDPAHVRRYFRQLFSTLDLDSKQIQRLREGLHYPEIAAQFRMIDEATEDVIITTYGDRQQQIKADIALLRAEPTRRREALRRLQPYTVAIFTRDAERYRRAGFIEALLPGELLPDVGIWNGVYHSVRGLVADDDRSLLVVA